MHISEVLLRGATVGVLILVALVTIKSKRLQKTRFLGALFAIGSAAYTMESSMILPPDASWAYQPVLFLAMQNCVFFWWFGMALLDDDFEWRSILLLPLALVVGLYLMQALDLFSGADQWADISVQVLTIVLMVHVVWLAVSLRGDDLLEKRRRFRVIFTFLVAAMCIAVAAIRLGLNGADPPAWLRILHSCELFILSIGFSVWLLQPAAILFDIARSPELDMSDGSSLDHHELERLSELMSSGFYKRDGLTIKELADSIEIPEHRLRQLINQRLGYRNFAAYLNSHRLTDAREILSNPDHSRRQITQIAFELGYGSIAPFNRAFKAQEGMTPTEFRRAALLNPASIRRNH